MPNTIVSNKIFIIAKPSIYLLGILSSEMHMSWVRQIGGRLKSDYSYSGSMVYNTSVATGGDGQAAGGGGRGGAGGVGRAGALPDLDAG